MHKRLIYAAIAFILAFSEHASYAQTAPRSSTPAVTFVSCAHTTTRRATPAVSFVNDVIPALTRSGCNQGTCHGAAVGKGGFKLSLRGYAPELDHVSITRSLRGRRISVVQPDQSLLLRKPLMQIPHMGGQALRPGSPELAIIRTWIGEGAPGPSLHDQHVVSLEPARASILTSPGASLTLRVRARFSDGSARDVTHWTRFGTNDENVATVQPDGAVHAVGYGETAITLAYQDRVAMTRLAVPFPNPVNSRAYRSLPRTSSVDGAVYNKLAAMRLWPSPVTSDREFIRRVSLDLIGTLPTPDDIHAFVADPGKNKRELLVDALMQRPEFVDFWSYIWSDLFKVNRGTLKDKGMWEFYAWIHESVEANKPWDRLCREVMTANGNTFEDGPANYFRTSLKTEELAENISQGMLGIRVQCAHCHNHPLDHWTQNEYYGMTNLFARVGRRVDNAPWVNDEMIVYTTLAGDIDQPRLGHPVPPKPLGGPAMAPTSLQERRAYFADWLTAPSNRQFVHSIVNRVWAHFMGRGLVEPVDDLRETNPPTNPELFELLSDRLVKHRFDLQDLMRTIVLSQAYQRSATPIALNRQDDRFYSRYIVRRLTAEQLLDALSSSTGVPESFPGMPASYRAIQLPDTHVKSDFMDNFGRPARQITCECERSQEPNMTQALMFINDATINAKVSADGGLVDRLTKQGLNDVDILKDIYWASLGRDPSSSEQKADIAAIERAPGLPVPATLKPAAAGIVNQRAAQNPEQANRRRRAFEDMLWVLVNSKEFLFNH